MKQIEVGVQVNGRTQAVIYVYEDEPAIGWQAQQIGNVKRAIKGRKIKQVCYVPEEIINIVTEK